MDRYRDTVFRKDVAGFMQLFAPAVRVFDMWERWSFEGAAEWQDMAEGWLGNLGEERVTVTFSEVQVREDALEVRGELSLSIGLALNIGFT